MKTAAIHANFVEGQSLPYRWAVTLIKRHLDPSKDSKEVVQFGNVNIWSDAFDAEVAIIEKVREGFAIEFPGYAFEQAEVVQFNVASDARLA